MAENNITESELRTAFETYLNDNPERQAEYDNMDNLQKSRMLEAFGRDYARRRNEGQRQENVETETDKRPGLTSDEWQQLINGDNTRFLQQQNFLQGIDIVTLDKMGKLPANFADMSPEDKARTTEELKAALTPEERLQFTNEEKTAKEALLETYPPKRLVDTDKWLLEAAANTEDTSLKAQLESAHDTVLATMIKKTEDYAKGDIVVDQSNVADVYNGANLMFDHIETQTEDDNVKNNITVSREKLEAEIKIYDDTNGFTNLSENDADAVRKAYEQVLKQADDVKFPPEEFDAFFSHLQFTSKDPAKGTADEAEREEILQMFHDSVRQQAARQTAVKHKDAKKEDLAAALNDEIQNAYSVQIGALLINNEMSLHAGEPDFTQTKAQNNVNKALADIEAGKDYTIDQRSMVGQFANYTNDSMGWLNRLGTKIGKKAPVLGMMYNKVRKFDDTCIERFSPLYGQLKSFGKAVRGNMARQALNQAVRWGSQLIPGGNFVYGTYVAGQAAWRLGTKYAREKEAAKKNGQKFSSLKWLGSHVGEITSSAMLATAAYLPGGNMVLGLGSAVVATGTNAIKSYKASRAKGESRWKAFRKSLTSSAASVGTAVASSLLLGETVKATGLDDFTADYFKQTVPAGEYDPTDSHYSQSPVTDAAKQEELMALDNVTLNEQGYTFEQGVSPDAEGAFLYSKGEDGFTTRDYSQDELDWATNRNDGIRYSEYLDKQLVHELYQDPNSSDPLAHSEVAHDNAISSLDKLAEKHPEMNSYIDGEFHSNSEMLLYKLYNANMLAPNPDAISDSGLPIGEVMGATDANGNLVTYQDVFQKVLLGEELTETDYQVITNVEDHIGGQYDGVEGGNNDMGKLKDFDTLGDGSRPVDSYNAAADVGYENHEHPGSEDVYARFIQTEFDPRTGGLPWGMVFDNQENGQQVMRERIGSNGAYLAQVRMKTKEQEVTPPPLPPVHKKPKEVIPPAHEETDEKPGYGKLLADEYKIIYGVDPQVVPEQKGDNPKYNHWIAYNNRVDEERKATGRDIDMYDFLTERRQKLDKVMESTGGLTLQGKEMMQGEVLKDYEAHKDNPGMAAAICGARQSIMQSNLTAHNYRDVITLSHFTDYTQHFIQSDAFVADGTRDISQNPRLKKDILAQDASSKRVYDVLDLNDYYVGNKTLKPYEAKPEKVPAADVLKQMRTISKKNPKNPLIAPQKGRE